MSCCKVKSQSVTLLVNFSVLVTYILLGALMFSSLELPHEKTRHVNYKSDLIKLNRSSSLVVQGLSYTMRDGSCGAVEAIEYFRNRDAENSTERSADHDEFAWTYTKSLMFSFETITTIGYGGLIPSTHIGKGMSLLFALTCIPLYYAMVMMYAKHGLDAVNSLVDKATNDTRKTVLVKYGSLIGFLVVAALVFGGVYNLTNKVDFGNSLWYTFATFTTIGFGDYYPINDNGTHVFYFILFVTLVYVFIGMLVLSWKQPFVRFHRKIERFSAGIFNICCDVTVNNTFEVEVGMSRLREEDPIDVEMAFPQMEAIQFDPDENHDENDEIFGEPAKN